MALHDSQEWIISTCVFSLIFAFMLAKLISVVISFRKANLRITRDPGETSELLFHEDTTQSVGKEGNVVRESIQRHNNTDNQKREVFYQEENVASIPGENWLSLKSKEEAAMLSSGNAAIMHSEHRDTTAESASLSSEIQEKIEEESLLSDEEDWEGIEGTQLERTFGKAASFLEKLVLSSTSNISNDLKLQLYGLYKQATEGPCASPQPPAYRLSARAKWNSWKLFGQISREEGMQRYIALITELCPDWNVTAGSKDGSESSDAHSFPKSEKTTGMGPVFSTLTQAKESTEDEGLEDLHIFAKEGNLKGVEDLLQSGLSIDQMDTDGRTALHWAADQGHLDIVTLLISRGAQVNLKDSEGQTPLHYAVTCEWEDIATLLLEKGADPSLVDNDGCTAYETSVEYSGGKDS